MQIITNIQNNILWKYYVFWKRIKLFRIVMKIIIYLFISPNFLDSEHWKSEFRATWDQYARTLACTRVRGSVHSRRAAEEGDLCMKRNRKLQRSVRHFNSSGRRGAWDGVLMTQFSRYF